MTTNSMLRPYAVSITRAREVATGIRRSTIDGGLEFYWQHSAGAGCLNGDSSSIPPRISQRARLPNKMRINIDMPTVGQL